MKAVLIILLVLGALLGGLLALRRSARTGMPPSEVLERAGRRARELDEQERREGEADR